jgi:hypothetical protein
VPPTNHPGLALSMTWSQPELDALKKAFASGTLRVSYEGRSVEYGSAADLWQRICTIGSEMAAAEGRPKPKPNFRDFRDARA